MRRNAGTDSDMSKRYRTLEHVYAQQWGEVENLLREGERTGVRPRPWREVVDAADAHRQRWYDPSELAAATAAWRRDVRGLELVSAAVLPNFVLIGAMRSGSTSLYKYLQAHPDVFMPRKEIHFFDRKWDRGLEWYESRVEGYAGQSAVGEATPTYLAEPLALDRMAAIIPDTRLLAVLRDPVDRAYSHYWMERIREREPRRFDEAVADEIEHRPGVPASDYLDRGRYLGQLEQVTARFARDRLFVVLLDDLRDRPHTTIRDVCRFLAVADGFVPPRIGERVNRFVGFRSMRGCATCGTPSRPSGGSGGSSASSTPARASTSRWRRRRGRCCGSTSPTRSTPSAGGWDATSRSGREAPGTGDDTPALRCAA